MMDSLRVEPLGFSCDTRLWGKTLPSGKNGETSLNHYPVIAHLLDTAAVAETLFNVWLPSSLVQTVNDKIGCSLEETRNFLVYSAGVHDIGKITPVFQYQAFNRKARTGFIPHRNFLQSVGYSEDWCGVEGTNSDCVKRMVRRHEIGSALFRDNGNLSPNMSVRGAVVAGHHGLYNIEEDYDEDGYSDFVEGYEYYSLLDRDRWGEQIRNHHTAIQHIVADPKNLDIPIPLVPLLTSIVCLADWIASSEDSINSTLSGSLLPLLGGGGNCSEDYYASLQNYYDMKRGWAEKYVPGLLGTPTKPASFGAAFPHIVEKNKPQEELSTVTPAGGTGLSIVMVPMGEGKTEAALGHWLEFAEPGEGIFFGLPTMATADSMFARVQNFFDTAPGTFGKLSHGKSILNSFYDLPESDTRIYSCDNDHDTEKSLQGLVPQKWFNGKHRALLAPVGVGTVDQLLASVLKHKYNFLRTLGIATKTIIIDEVHTFDAYQASLLENFLSWSQYFRVRVILLSATLPQGKVKKYLQAYGHKGEMPPYGFPYPSIVNLSCDEGAEPEIIDLSDSVNVKEKTVQLFYVENPDNTADTIRDKVQELVRKHPTAKIGVIVNTVSTAMHISEELTETHPELIVLHSRMTARMRAENTTDAIRRFGKTSTNGPDLLVSTQIVECSVDLDFDIIVSEIAPMASLIQRAGRLWRHNDPQRRSRPDSIPSPQFFVTSPKNLEQVKEDGNSTAFLPYSTAEILKTWGSRENQTGLREGTLTSFTVPSQLSSLLEESEVSVQELNVEQNKILESHVRSEYTKKLAAKDVVVPVPKRMRTVADLCRYTSNLAGDPEYMTRWIETVNLTIIPCNAPGKQKNVYAYPEGTLPVSPNKNQLLRILDYTVPLSGTVANKVSEALDENPHEIFPPFQHSMLEGVIPIKIGYPYPVSAGKAIVFNLTEHGFSYHNTAAQGDQF